MSRKLNRKSWTIVFVATLCSLSIAAPAMGLTVVNPGAETGDKTGWTQFDITGTGITSASTEQKQQGNYSFKFDSIGTTNKKGGLYQRIQVVPNTAYTMSCYHMNPSGANSLNQIGVDPNGGTGLAGWNAATKNTAKLSATWVSTSVTAGGGNVTVTSGAGGYITIYIAYVGTAAGQRFGYFDNIVVTGPDPVSTTDIVKANNSDKVDLGSSWTGGVVPGSDNIAVWDSTSGANISAAPEADMNWAGIRIGDTTGASGVAPAGQTLTLGVGAQGMGIDMTAATGDFSFGPNITMSAANIWDVAASRTLSIGGSIANAGGLTIRGAGSTSVEGVISGTGKLTKSGAGTLTLSGANTYSGGTTLSGGVLVMNSDGESSPASSPIGTGPLTISAACIIDVGAAPDSVTLRPNMSQNWNAGFTFAGSKNLDMGTGAVTLGGNTTVTVDGSTLTVGGVISGTGVLIKLGAGTLTLTGDNAYTGKTYIGSTGPGGTLQIDREQCLGVASVVGRPDYLYLNNGGILKTTESFSIDDPNRGVTVGAGAGGGAFAPDGGTTLTIANVIAGVASDAGLNMNGNGTLILSGTNTYTGGTTVSLGTLAVTGHIKGNVSVTGGILELGSNTALDSTATINLPSVPGTGIVNLNFDGTQSISTLKFGATTKAAGTWGAVGSGAQHTNAIFTGTGILNVASGVPTSTVLSSIAGVCDGSETILTATVTPSTASGSVEFFDGTTSLGTAVLSEGTATKSVVLSAGVHADITAKYLGDDDNDASTSNSQSATVTPMSTFYRDADGDSYGNAGITELACSPPAGYVTDSLDCDDSNNAINPGAAEVCDGVDNDCDGQTDEDVTTTYYLDADNDGAGDPDFPIQACNAPPGYVDNGNDLCPADSVKTSPGVCGCGISDTQDTDGDGTVDCLDACVGDPDKTAPGACGCGVADTDTDGDLTPDCIDACPGDPAKTDAGACGCGVADTDTDEDGTADCNDQCPADPNKTAPGICDCGNSDTLDTDSDGTVDCLDGCPSDPAKTAVGVCGCGVADTDTDGDLTPDCIDGCPSDPNKTAPGVCGCGAADDDSDDDGTPDCNDLCPNNPDKIAGGVCGCEAADIDSDNDGTLDCNDQCPNDPNKTVPGDCGCGIAETDTDGDLMPDCIDGCPSDPDKTAVGVCGCGIADTDSDGDGTPNCTDLCPSDPDKVAPGTCGCGISDTLDTDGDGTVDCLDGCPDDPDKSAIGACGCGVADTDTDGDGTADCVDVCPADPDKATDVGVCGCGVADADSDSDGTKDCEDGCPNDPGKTIPGVCGCNVADTDSDNDGTPDCIDACPADGTKTTMTTYYADADGDGYGNSAATVEACEAPVSYVADNTDCDDSNAAVYPANAEVCDGLDNNCNGEIDEGVKTVFYRDADGDGYGNADVSIEACSAPAGYVADNTDCNDNNAAAHPPTCVQNMLYLEPTAASIYVKPTETVTVNMSVANLQKMVTACQALLGFSSTYFQTGSSDVVVAAGGGVWNELIYNMWTMVGELDVAVGVSLDLPGGTQEDNKIAYMILKPTGYEGVTSVVFRPDVNGGYATMFSDINHQPLLPNKIDSVDIYVDGTPPTITCPADKVVSADAGVCMATGVDLGTPIVTDAVSGVDTVTNDAPAIFPKGDTIVTWTATDRAGNVATCTQKVTVNDTELPVIVCPADATVECGPQTVTPDPSVTGTATATDNCGPEPTITFADSITPGSCGQAMTIARTWTATDSSGNSSTCVQSITVQDTTPPVISCPASITVNADEGLCAATVDPGVATAVDNCDSSPVVIGTRSDNQPLNAAYPRGVTTITWTATDACGNVSTCSQTVTVNDNQNPTVSITSAAQGGQELLNTTIKAVQGAVEITVSGADNCGLTSEPIVVVKDAADVETTLTATGVGPWVYTFMVTETTANGLATITATVLDEAGNSVSDTDTFNINKNQITGTVAFATLRSTAILNPYSPANYSFNRTVTLVATDAAGVVLKSWTPSLSFTNDPGTQIASAVFTLTNVPANTAHLSSKTAWHLRKREAAGLDGNGQAVVDFTLLGGDIRQDNYVNILDYSALKNVWNTTSPIGDIGDINGDGLTQLLDYTLMQGSWFKAGDSQ